MKKEIIIKENGKIVKRVMITVRDEDHFKAQLKHKKNIVPSKKKYNRKKMKKPIDML